jgi:FMN-dependent oxidoreductase (nitrilotriacetate monooxygenase family)
MRTGQEIIRMIEPRRMRLGMSIRWLGYHVASWRHPQVPADGPTRFDFFLDSARKAEAAKLDMIFFADSLAIRGEDNPPGSLCRDLRNVELEPLTLLAALGACTTHIGLAATASTSYNAPYHIARKYASIDNISKGRAAWNVVTSYSKMEAMNFNRDEHLSYDERYGMAAEFVDVVAGLWDSWDNDAFIRNKESGQFYDPAKRHVLNHVGQYFKVRGPLGAARSPQGRPIIIQAGASEPGRIIGARTADVIYSSTLDVQEARSYYADMKRRAAGFDRDPAHMLIMPGITLYVGSTRAKAEVKFQQIQELIDPLTGLASLFSYFGDLSEYDLDGPVPEPKDPHLKSVAENLYKRAQRENLSIRDLYRLNAAASSGMYLVGTPSEIVDTMEDWFNTGAADGFNICPPVMPAGLEDFVELVLPEIRRRGLFRTEYEGNTLRQNLGLPEPRRGDIAARRRTTATDQ